MNLNCYFATVQKVQKEKQGVYAPVGTTNKTTNYARWTRIVKAMNDASKYNVLGCRHGNYNGFGSRLFEARGASRTKTRWPIAITRQEDGTHFCYPKPPSHRQVARRIDARGGEKDGGVRETIMGGERGFKMRMALLNRPGMI